MHTVRAMETSLASMAKVEQPVRPVSHRRTEAFTMRLALEDIDTKLAKHKNTEAERALLIARRRHVAKAERHGARTLSRKFILDTAHTTGLSRATIYRDLRRVDELGIALLEKIVGTSLDHGRQLDALLNVPAAERENMVRRALKCEPVGELKGRRTHE